MDSKLLPRWMIRTIAMLLIACMTMLLINQIRSFVRSPQVMHVSAEGQVTATPDTATIKIGVISEQTDSIAVKNQNNHKMNQVTDYLKKQGVNSQDIQTSELYISPKYHYTNGTNSIIGYQATQIVTVKIRKINTSKTMLEKLLSEVIHYGANNIQSIDLSFADTKQFKEAARINAINNANEKAKAIASAANLTLGKIINVIEGAEHTNYPAARAMVAFNATQAKSVEPNIQLGSQEVTANITLLFEVY